MPECSIAIGDSEGYGERRLCKLCSLKRISNADETLKSQESIEMNYKEKWAKKKSTKKSYYLKADPLYDKKMALDTNTTSKASKIPILINGNCSTTIHKIDGKHVALENTCSFDSVIQVSFIISKQKYMQRTDFCLF